MRHHIPREVRGDRPANQQQRHAVPDEPNGQPVHVADFHHFTSPSASAGRVFSTAVTGTVEFFVCNRLSPFASGCGPSLVGSVGLSVSMVEVKRAYVERARSHEGQARS